MIIKFSMSHLALLTHTKLHIALWSSVYPFSFFHTKYSGLKHFTQKSGCYWEMGPSKPCAPLWQLVLVEGLPEIACHEMKDYSVPSQQWCSSVLTNGTWPHRGQGAAYDRVDSHERWWWWLLPALLCQCQHQAEALWVPLLILHCYWWRAFHGSVWIYYFP